MPVLLADLVWGFNYGIHDVNFFFSLFIFRNLIWKFFFSLIMFLDYGEQIEW
jgi:hypothetical protein